jgi:hypothetical protein
MFTLSIIRAYMNIMFVVPYILVTYIVFKSKWMCNILFSWNVFKKKEYCTSSWIWMKYTYMDHFTDNAQGGKNAEWMMQSQWKLRQLKLKTWGSSTFVLYFPSLAVLNWQVLDMASVCICNSIVVPTICTLVEIIIVCCTNKTVNKRVT